MDKIKVLFLAANPSDTNRLRLDVEVREVKEKIRAAEYRDSLELLSEWAVRPDDLLQYLNQYRPHIVHFAGHGSTKEELILEDNQGKPKPVSKKALVALFRALKDNIRVVVLNACYSRPQAEAITTQIDCAVGMKRAIGDNAAITFAASFYRAIGFGRSIQEAFDQGITALLLEGIPEEDTPVLHTRDGVDANSITLIRPASELEDDSGTPQPQRISLAKMPTMSPDLFGREKELATLDEAWDDPKTNLVTLVAFGGVGKTALVNKWLLNMREHSYRGARRVFGWSFYSQGAAEGKQASADLFIAAALKWFGDPDPTEGSPWEKGERLAALVNEHPTLLVLDGMEPLQYPPASAGREGGLKDPGLQTLLRELARHNKGLCVVTTRLSVSDVQEFVDTSVRRVDLDQLSPEAGAVLLEKLGVEGTDAELKDAVDEFGGHALALTLMGRYLATAHDGDIRRRDLIAKLTKEPKDGGHARRVMESYEKWFKGKPELQILRIMGLFDRPADGGAIKAVKDGEPINGLTSVLVNRSHDNWRFAVRNLREARLLAEEDPSDRETLDCHPLIREHFGEKLQAKHPKVWKEAHSRLYEYFRNLPEKELPDTLEEMAPLYAAIMHGCEAGFWTEALDTLYRRRMHRGIEHYHVNYLGAVSADLAVLASFFERPWDKTVECNGLDHAFVLHEAGLRLFAVGRLNQALLCLDSALSAYIVRNDWRRAAGVSRHLSRSYLVAGDFAKALQRAEESVEHARRFKPGLTRVMAICALGHAHHQRGDSVRARVEFKKAERLHRDIDREHPLLYRLHGYRYCDLLLDRGKLAAVKCRTQRTAKYKWQHKFRPGSALNRAMLGQVHMREQRFEEAEGCLNEAVDLLTEMGQVDHLLLALLARAGLHRDQARDGGTGTDVKKAMLAAQRGEMRLHEADCHLEYARLHLAQKDKEGAREHLDTAGKMIDEMGYHRRDPEVLLETARLRLLEGDKKAARQSLAKAKKLIDEMGCHRWDIDAAQIETEL